MIAHGRASEYLDGALDDDEEIAFLEHVAGCAECQAALHDEVQLRDREDALRDAAGAAQPRVHGRAEEYLDGALDGELEVAFLDHAAACSECQRELHDGVQLRAREDALRDASAPARAGARDGAAEQAPGAGVTPLRPRRRRSRWTGLAGVCAAAAAAAVLWLVLRPDATPPGRDPIALTLKPQRSIEIRLSRRDAARHRPYDTMRGDTSPASARSEPIMPAVVAELDRAGDCHGVATAYLLRRELESAEEQYRRCPAGADIDADRAGLAILRGDLDGALELTERVLGTAPDHAVALWNRALALRDLGLELSAAAAFERVAALEAAGDPGWAREAGDRARAIRAEIDPVRTAFEDVRRLGFEMVHGGPPLDSSLARRVPARARVMLHDAIRTATTAARLDELAPLAAALEGHAGDDLARYLAEARARLSPARAEASAGYRAIVDRPGAVDDAAWARWLALATRARAEDLILGARILTRRLDGDPPADQLAAATGDPWFRQAIELARARAALEAGRLEDGAARLTALAAQCPPSTPTYRCLQLEVMLADLELDRHRPPEAKRHAVTAIALARRLGEWPQRSQALTIAGDAERFGGGFAAARAYYEEAGLSRDACGKRATTFSTAEMLFQDHQFPQASALVAAAPACDQAPGIVELKLLIRLLRAGHADRAAVEAELARARGARRAAQEAAFFEFLTEWIALDDDPGARARLERIREAAGEIEGAMRPKTINAVDNALLADAGRRGAWTEALAVIARARGVDPPARCALAFGADDFRFAVVAVGPDGVVAGRYEPDLVRPAEWLAPEPMRRKLAGCDEVAVLALAPWLGIGPVLDPQTPWHYALGPAPAPAAGRRRHVVIANPAPPPSAGLAPLVPRTWPTTGGPDEVITGPAATPERTLAVMSDATLVEIHSHAAWFERLDAPALALSPGAGGWTLDAAKIRAARLTGAPVVVLADCAGGTAAQYEHEAWGLPLAFRTAGASAVIASLSPIPDRAAAAFFDAVTAEIARGAAPAAAVARARAEKIRGDSASWVRNVVVFR